MANTSEFLDFFSDQCSGLGEIEFRRMFGVHAAYCDGRFFAFIFSDVVYIKLTPEGVNIAKNCTIEPPIKEFKPWIRVNDIEDKDSLHLLIRTTLENLPMPKPKKHKKPKDFCIFADKSKDNESKKTKNHRG